MNPEDIEALRPIPKPANYEELLNLFIHSHKALIKLIEASNRSFVIKKEFK